MLSQVSDMHARLEAMNGRAAGALDQVRGLVANAESLGLISSSSSSPKRVSSSVAGLFPSAQGEDGSKDESALGSEEGSLGDQESRALAPAEPPTREQHVAASKGKSEAVLMAELSQRKGEISTLQEQLEAQRSDIAALQKSLDAAVCARAAGSSSGGEDAQAGVLVAELQGRKAQVRALTHRQ